MITVVLSASFASVIAQMQTLRARPVVRLPASQVVLGANVGGMSLELLNASPILNLPVAATEARRTGEALGHRC